MHKLWRMILKRFSRGLWIIVRPNSLKLVQLVSAEYSPVSCQIFKVVHDDSNEQVDNLREKDMTITAYVLHK